MPTGTYEGTVFALQHTPAISTLPRAAVAGGEVYCSIDKSTALTAIGLGGGTGGCTHKVGKLPKNAVVLYSLVYPIDTDTYDAPDGLTTGVTGSLGIAGDTDLFGDVADMNASALPQVVIPKPDGTTYTNRLCPLEADVDVLFTSATADWTATEGFCVEIYYTLAGQI